MRPETGRMLRLVGPLIEIVCALAIVRGWGRGLSFGGVPAEYAWWAGLAAGLAMVIAGLTLVRRPPPSRRPPPD